MEYSKPVTSGNWWMNKHRYSLGIRHSAYLYAVGCQATAVDYFTWYSSYPDRRGWGTVFVWNMKDFAKVSISGLRTLKRIIIIKLIVIDFLTFGFWQSVCRQRSFACLTQHLLLCFMQCVASQLAGKHRFAFLKCLSCMPDEAFLSCRKASSGLRKRLFRGAVIYI